MAAYLIARIEVTDPVAYADYAGRTAELAERWGGRFLVKGGAAVQLEGPGPARHVVVAFPDREAALGFYGSAEYRAILPVALRSSRREVVVVEGV